jgi:hypothetical protein
LSLQNLNIIAAENCPFKIEPKTEGDSDTHRKDRFVSFDVPLDTAAQNPLMATHEFLNLKKSLIC